MEEKEVDVQNFNGKEYFLYDTITKDDEIYDIFAKVEDPKDIIVAKEIMEKDGFFYEILEEESKDEIISLYKGNN